MKSNLKKYIIYIIDKYNISLYNIIIYISILFFGALIIIYSIFDLTIVKLVKLLSTYAIFYLIYISCLKKLYDKGVRLHFIVLFIICVWMSGFIIYIN